MPFKSCILANGENVLDFLFQQGKIEGYPQENKCDQCMFVISFFA